jgi:glycosyltransferase involved in cell wall biosynthesis
VGIRVVVVDDNPHVSWQGRVYPVNATFHRFLSAVLDVPGAPVASIVHAVPLRPASEPPRTLPLDERLEVAGTEPFDGIAGFLRNAPAITRRNVPILRAALAEADLLWLKVPASNALLATVLARRARVARFVYVAGSALDVVAGQRRGLLGGLAARAVAAAYDGIGRLVAVGGQRVVVGEDIVGGRGLVTSLVEPAEVREPRAPRPREPGRLRLAWAGRLAAGKGIEALLDAVARLDASVTLELLGDGPARGELEASARAMALSERVAFAGYLAERAPYLDSLAAADLFVFPSPAEGFPKVVLDAMAVGLPVVASTAGNLRALGAADLVESVPAGDAGALTLAIRRLADDPGRAALLTERGREFAASHTRPAEAARLVESWRASFPGLQLRRGPG